MSPGSPIPVMDQASDNPHLVRHSLFAFWRWPRWTWIFVGPMLPASYIFSIGPIVWLVEHNLVPAPVMPFLMFVYQPLELLAQMPSIGHALRIYVEWWRELP